MSVDYDICCHAHKERVSICSDGVSGPLLQCDRSLAAFIITHRACDLCVIDEHNESHDDYKEWGLRNWEELLRYEA